MVYVVSAYLIALSRECHGFNYFKFSMYIVFFSCDTPCSSEIVHNVNIVFHVHSNSCGVQG